MRNYLVMMQQSFITQTAMIQVRVNNCSDLEMSGLFENGKENRPDQN